MTKMLLVILITIGFLSNAIAKDGYCKISDRTQINIANTVMADNVPIFGVISGAVHSNELTATLTANKNAIIVNKIYKKWQKLGFDKSDIHTTAYQLMPVNIYNERTQTNVNNGFSLDHQLEFTIKNSADLGRIADILLGAGLNIITQIGTSYKNNDILNNELRLKALEESRLQAMEIMNKMGGHDLTLQSLQNSSIENREPMVMNMMAKTADMGTKISPVENPYKLSLNTIWEYCR